MARLFAVATRDRQLAAYHRPFFVPTKGFAVRSFTDEVNRKAADNPMFAHPEDYELFHIGYFDEDTGVLERLDVAESLCVASNVVVKE